MSKLFGTDGIRGIAGEFLTEELAERTARAIARVEQMVNESGRPLTAIIGIGNTYLHSSSNNMGNKLNNGSIHTFNTKVLDYCNQNGLDFIDVAYALVDDNGCLGTEFCSDVGSSVACHLNKNAFNAWTELLRDYAGKKQAGRWANPTELKGFNY